MQINPVRSFALLFLTFPLSACVTADFKEPISDFTASMSTANAAVGSYFLALNDFERSIYLEEALKDPTIQVGVSTNGKPTGLIGTFSPESIKARMDALSLLTVYGERLAALAGADAPARFNAGSAVLGQNLSSLANTFNGLAGKGDSSAAAYTGPIATILGVFGEMVLDAKREAALVRAINEGAPAVDKILNQIELDLITVVTPLQATGALANFQGTVAYYNTNRTTLPYSEREVLLKKIGQQAQLYQDTVSLQPAEAIDSIRDAHAALVAYANSPRKPQDLTALVAALETFNNRLEPVVNSINELRGEDDD